MYPNHECLYLIENFRLGSGHCPKAALSRTAVAVRFFIVGGSDWYLLYCVL
jgi:hypothetical protein